MQKIGNSRKCHPNFYFSILKCTSNSGKLYINLKLIRHGEKSYWFVLDRPNFCHTPIFLMLPKIATFGLNYQV